VGSLSGASDQGMLPWRCPACTLANTCRARRCRVCQCPRPKEGQPDYHKRKHNSVTPVSVKRQAEEGANRNLCGAHVAYNICKTVSTLIGVQFDDDWKMDRTNLVKRITGQLKDKKEKKGLKECLESVRTPGAFLTEQAVEMLMSPYLSIESVRFALSEKKIYVASPFIALMLSHGDSSVVENQQKREKDSVVILPFHTGTGHWTTLVWDRKGVWKNVIDHFWIMDSLPMKPHTTAAESAAKRVREAYASMPKRMEP